MEALGILPVLLPMNVTVFCFDFSGCGKSEGEYISLGYYEKEDLKVVIEHLRKSKKVSTIGLWGRSMGAVTVLLYCGLYNQNNIIHSIVLDSPFSSLKKLAKDHIKDKINLLVDSAFLMINTTV